MCSVLYKIVDDNVTTMEFTHSVRAAIGHRPSSLVFLFARVIIEWFGSAIPKVRYSETRINHGSGGEAMLVPQFRNSGPSG